MGFRFCLTEIEQYLQLPDVFHGSTLCLKKCGVEFLQ